MPTKNEIIEALQFGFFYTKNPLNGSDDPAYTITFQFEDSVPVDDISGLSGWSAWTAADKAAVIAALAHIETFLNVDFVEVTGNSDPDLNLGRVSLPGSTAGIGGPSIWYSGTSIVDYDSFAVFDNALTLTNRTNLILHEIGHALGLAHPFDGATLDPAYHNNHYTVMSYSADPASGQDNDAMMLYDLLALQDIWGAAAYNTGDTTYTGPRTDNVDTVWDTGGTDTFDASARSNDVRLNLRDGKFSTFGDYEDLSIAFGVTIENAVGGSGDDKLFGNKVANTLSGNGGKDLLNGKGGKDLLEGDRGADALKGGGGKDMLYGGGGRDILVGGGGTDKLWGDGGADTFCFKVGAAKDMVMDFESGVDRLKVIGFGSRAEVLAAAYEAKGRVYFDLGDGDRLVVMDMTLSDLKDDLLVI